MALILPSPNDLQDYIEGPSDEQNIQQAMDLFVMATGLSATSSSLEDRLVKSAVLEMAWALGSRHEDREAEFSAFTSERIGSYSYNKAAKSINEGQATGVPNFDAAVSYFLTQALSSLAGTSSEYVFTNHDYGHGVMFHDPSMTFFPEEDFVPSGPPIHVIDDVDYDELPAYSTITITKVNGVWPGVPTNRTDTTIIWKGEEPSPPTVQVRTIGMAGMLDNVDLRVIVD